MRRTAMKFEEARRTQKSVSQSAKALGTDTAREAWDSLVGRGLLKTDPVAVSVELTVKADDVPLLRRGDGIPAAFALAAIVEQLDEVDRSDELAVRGAVAKAWEAFEIRKQLANDIQEGFGWDLSAAWMTVRAIDDDPYRARMVREIAKLAGRMYRAMRGVKVKRQTDQPQEVKEVTIGGDLERLLASEHAQMADEGSLGDLAVIRVMQRKASQFRMQGEAEAKRGPLVIVLDSSGSMHDEWSAAASGDAGSARWCRGKGTGRNTWAKACAVALTRIAHEDDRMVRVVHFSTSTHVDECKPGDPKAVVQMAGTFLSGGTAIGLALRVAISQVGDLEKEGFEGADIVLVSDGEDHKYVEFNRLIAVMRQKGIRLWTVGIAVDYETDNPLRSEAERYLHVHGSRLTADAAKGLEKAAQAEPRRNR